MRGRERWIALALAAVAGGCGGGGGQTANNGPDGGGTGDAPAMPMPPALGAQLDRMGRPGVGEFLIGTFGDAGAADRQAAYRQAMDPKTWLTTTLATNVTIASELKANLGPFDAIDTGMVINTNTLPGCTDALDYVNPATATSYDRLISLLGDDELYLDTAKATCTTYLSLELELTSSGSFAHTTCGGRMLGHNAFDILLSLLAAGLSGLDVGAGLAPRLHSAATAHADITNTFPFLGAPNP